jgi:hypothetical protein
MLVGAALGRAELADVRVLADVEALKASVKKPPAEPEREGVVVLRQVGGTSLTTSGKEAQKEFDRIAGKRLPLLKARNVSAARSSLTDEFPHLVDEIDLLLAGLIDGQPILFRPTLLVGDPGGGKSRLARRLMEEVGGYLHRYDGSSSGDNAFGGTSRRWSTGEHSVPLEAVRRSSAANPTVLVDEIDKAATRRDNGRLSDALIPLLDRETAQRYPDPYVQSEVDLSHVSYLVTANEDSALPAPLKDRLRIVRFPRPKLEHMPQLARAIVRDIAQGDPLGPQWVPMLDDGELAVAESLWRRGGSVRRLAAIVTALIENRERKPRN